MISPVPGQPIRLSAPVPRVDWARVSEVVAERERERDAARGAVARLVDLFSGPDERRMRHASVTDATIKRYCAEAGIRDAPAYDTKGLT